MKPLLHRVAETNRATLHLTIDGATVSALEGDTVLTSILVHGARLRLNEFDTTPRAGFCLMGACQDCWVWTEEGVALRACSTPVANGMRIVTGTPPWP